MIEFVFLLVDFSVLVYSDIIFIYRNMGKIIFFIFLLFEVKIVKKM